MYLLVKETLCFESSAYFLPVDDIEEGSDIVRSPVLVVQVVGVLPDVKAKDRCASTAYAGHEWVVLIG